VRQLEAREEIEGEGKGAIGSKRLIDVVVAGCDGWLVLVLCSQWSGSFGSSKVSRVLATELHPHLIALV